MNFIRWILVTFSVFCLFTPEMHAMQGIVMRVTSMLRGARNSSSHPYQAPCCIESVPKVSEVHKENAADQALAELIKNCPDSWRLVFDYIQPYTIDFNIAQQNPALVLSSEKARRILYAPTKAFVCLRRPMVLDDGTITITVLCYDTTTRCYIEFAFHINKNKVISLTGSHEHVPFAYAPGLSWEWQREQKSRNSQHSSPHDVAAYKVDITDYDSAVGAGTIIKGSWSDSRERETAEALTVAKRKLI